MMSILPYAQIEDELRSKEKEMSVLKMSAQSMQTSSEENSCVFCKAIMTAPPILPSSLPASPLFPLTWHIFICHAVQLYLMFFFFLIFRSRVDNCHFIFFCIRKEKQQLRETVEDLRGQVTELRGKSIEWEAKLKEKEKEVC
jgi:hypothetical protein